jgi:hypothetical protein
MARHRSARTPVLIAIAAIALDPRVSVLAGQTVPTTDGWHLDVATVLISASHAKGDQDKSTQNALPTLALDLRAQGDTLVSVQSGEQTQSCDGTGSNNAKQSCEALSTLVSTANRLSMYDGTKSGVEIGGNALAILTGGCPTTLITFKCDDQRVCRGSQDRTSVRLSLTSPGVLEFASECQQTREEKTLTSQQRATSPPEALVSVTVTSKTTGRLAKS